MRGIFSTVRKLMLWHSQPVYMIVPTTGTANDATNADRIDSQTCLATLADDIYYKVVVAKAVTLAPHARKPAFAESTGLRR